MRAAIRYILPVMNIIGCVAALILAAIIFYNNFLGPCAHAPATVPFEQGMTLCPGQTARDTLRVQPEGAGR